MTHASRGFSRLALASVIAFSACTGEVFGGGEGSSGPPSGGAPDQAEAPSLGGKEPILCAREKAWVGRARIWRLTRSELDRSLRTLLGADTQAARERLPQEFAVHGFLNNADALRVREPEAVQLHALAKELAEETVNERLDRVYPCGDAGLADASCQRQFIETFGNRAFRRPLADAEVERYAALFAMGTSKGDARLGVQVVIEAMLQSPKFLFRSEVGEETPRADGMVRLTPHEIASALSYYLTGDMPDDALLEVADSGALADDAEVARQARRLTQLPESHPVLREFFFQLFEYNYLTETNKNPEIFPNFTSLKSSMFTELDRFVEHVLFEDDATLATLLTANYTFVDQGLATLYGAEVEGMDFRKFDTRPEERSGALTLTGLLSHLAVDNRTSPVARGKFVRERLLCTHIPDPPEGIDISLPALEPGGTAREQLEQRTAPPVCATCHGLMNPIGFAFESLDSIGQFRSEENGAPLDVSGMLTETDVDGSFEGVVELAQKLSTSAQVRQCVAIQAFRHGVGRPEGEADACTVRAMIDHFESEGADLRELPIALVTSESFLYRYHP